MTVEYQLNAIADAVALAVEPGVARADRKLVRVGRRIVESEDDIYPQLWEIERRSVVSREAGDYLMSISTFGIEGFAPWNDWAAKETEWQDLVEEVIRKVNTHEPLFVDTTGAAPARVFDQLFDGDSAVGLQVIATGQVLRLGSLTARGALCVLPALQAVRRAG